jgi:hypothetical protein
LEEIGKVLGFDSILDEEYGGDQDNKPWKDDVYVNGTANNTEEDGDDDDEDAFLDEEDDVVIELGAIHPRSNHTAPSSVESSTSGGSSTLEVHHAHVA